MLTGETRCPTCHISTVIRVRWHEDGTVCAKCREGHVWIVAKKGSGDIG